MRLLADSAKKLITRSLYAALRFPATVICAFFATLIASVRLELLDSQNISLLIALQLALYTTAALSLSLEVAWAGRSKKAWSHSLVNLAALPVLLLLWLLFYSAGREIDSFTLARASFISLAALALLPALLAQKSSSLDLGQALFFLLKAAVTAAVFSLALMLGLLFITFAIQSLLYQHLAENIYLHISLWSLFVWLPISVSFLPDLGEAGADKLLESGSSQPRFIKVLFLYVLIPLFALLALVLLAWAVRIVLTGQWPDYSLLSFILLAFAISGSALAVLTSQTKELSARLFARIFPPAALVFLLFTAWATGLELKVSGLQSASYFVIMLELFALACVLILLLGQRAKNNLIAYVAAALCLISIMPALNYRTVPVFFQQQDLSRVLEENQMLLEGKIVARADLSPADKSTISRSVDYLLSAELQPVDWLAASITNLGQFEEIFGFPYLEGQAQPGQSQNEFGLFLPPTALDISQANLIAFAANEDRIDFGPAGQPLTAVLVRQSAAQYTIVISRDGEVIKEQDLADWLESLMAHFGPMPAKRQQDAASLADLSLLVELDNYQITFIFNAVYASQDQTGSVTGDYLSLYCALYQEN